MSESPSTSVAILTPIGRGAIATIVVDGPQATEVVARLFVGAASRPFSEQPLNRILFGRWTTGEELVVARRAADRLEIHCHGGQAASAAILASLVGLGCREISWQEWIRRESDDEAIAAARIALASARTERTAAIVFDQLDGAWRRALEEIESLRAAGDETTAQQRIDELLSRVALGRHLTEPWRVVIAGPPNVGKSSLINALVGYERAITYFEPGTTRDIVTANTAIDGWPIEFSDTAGLRETSDPIEATGVTLAERRLDEADLALLVFDLAAPWTAEHAALVADYPEAIVVHNKLDLATTEPSPRDRPPGLRVSALARAGLDEMENAISRRLVPDAPAPGAALPLTKAQIDWLNERGGAAKNRSSR